MAKKIVCTLPNASTHISGIEFELTDEGAVSKEVISEKDAARFGKIPGYQLVEAEEPKDPPAAKKSASTGKSAKTSGDGE
jgi:hypothetical protein